MKSRLRKVVKGCISFLIGANTLLLLIIFSFFMSFIIVFPLWKLAVNYTKAYTITSITFFSIMFIFWIIHTCIKKYKRNPRMFLYAIVKKSLLIIGIVAFLFFLFQYQRILAFSILAISIIIYIFLTFGFLEDKV